MKRWKWAGISAVMMVACSSGSEDLATVTANLQTLPGSNFEIDDDANLRVDGGPGALDWANVEETRQDDLPSGKDDNSFGQGAKEDDEHPTIVSGSIPPNKSDLKTFGVYQEGTTQEGFLNLFWTRVQDPKGTTNMDFEFNQRHCTPDQVPADPDCSNNGLTPLRTPGDILITYDLSKGGTVPVLSLREWTGDHWGPPEDLSASLKAAGAINTSPIPAAESDGLGDLDPRTFGEAQIALSAIFEDPTKCESFGSAYVKSRSSDSFSAALKDFIAPIAVSITNCGRVVVHKVDTLGQLLAGAGFTIDPPSSGVPPETEMTELLPGIFCIENMLFDTEYTVTESQVPPGFTGAPPQQFTVTEPGTCSVVDSETAPDLTFVNEAALSDIVCAFRAQVPGATDAVIQCVGPDGMPLGEPTSLNGFDKAKLLEDLQPGQYTCTVNIVLSP